MSLKFDVHNNAGKHSCHSPPKQNSGQEINLWVGATNTINPLHHKHLWSTEISVNKWNFHTWIILEVLVEIFNVASLLQMS
jgi:hypothetical protein